MLRAARFLVALAWSVALFGCSQVSGPPVDAPAPKRAGDVVIAQLVTHDAKVAIVGGGRELRVVVRDLHGAMVADGVTLTDLRARDPELYTLVTSSFAVGGAPNAGDYVDATLDLRHRN